jgi:MarR family transcriptional regulator, 2-MHQ and catechol-resistance regulon repressor
MKERDRHLDTFTKFVRAHSSLMSALNAEQTLPKGMTISQFGVLEALMHKGPLTHCEIAQKILKSRGNLTMVIDHLERDGLVERLPVAGDRRAVRVALTPTGEHSIASIFPAHAEAIRKVLGVLSADELEELGRLSRKLGLALAAGKSESTSAGGAV